MNTSAWSLSAVGATKYAFPVGVRLDSLAHLLGVSCSHKPKKQGCDYLEVALGPEDISVVGITGQ